MLEEPRSQSQLLAMSSGKPQRQKFYTQVVHTGISLAVARERSQEINGFPSGTKLGTMSTLLREFIQASYWSCTKKLHWFCVIYRDSPWTQTMQTILGLGLLLYCKHWGSYTLLKEMIFQSPKSDYFVMLPCWYLLGWFLLSTTVAQM